MPVYEVKTLENLKIWQDSMGLALMICKQVLPNLPLEEKWAMTGQLRRSAQSIPANIAEGYGRFYYQGTIRFCYVARGSLMETLTYLRLANQIGYLQDPLYSELMSKISSLLAGINGYIAFLKRIKRGENEPGAVLQMREESPAYMNDDDSPNSQSTNS